MQDEIILLPLSDGAKEMRVSISSDLYGMHYAITPDGSLVQSLETPST